MYEVYKKVTVRLNKNDYAGLYCQSEKIGKTMNEYLRELIRKDMFEDIKDFNLFLDDIRKQTRILSNNINQLAKFKNKGLLFEEIEAAQKLNEEVSKLCQLLKS